MSDKEGYIKTCIKQAHDYAYDVIDGRILSNKYIRMAADRHVKDMNDGRLFLNDAKIEEIFGFCYYIFIDSNLGSYTRFRPEPWQCFYLLSIYGWYWVDRPHRRRFTTSFLTIARKNGKTVLAVVQCLYHLTKGGIDQKTYVVSESLNMAEDSALSYAKKIVENSPALNKRVENKQYNLRYTKGKSTSYFKMLPNKPEALNAIKPSFIIIDELHLMPTSEIVDKARSGMGATMNPLLCIVGTRGNDSTYYQFELEQSYIKILRGELQDDSTFIMMYCLDKEEEATDTNAWIKANPNIGSSLFIDNLLDEYHTAKLTPVSLKVFFIDHFNLWVDGSDEDFIEEQYLKIAFKKGSKLFKKPTDLSFFIDKKVYLGVDTSRTNDLSSLSVLHYEEDTGTIYLFTFVYFPDNPTKKHRTGGVDLHQWIRTGWIKEHPGKRINYDLIVEDIEAINSIADVQGLGYDTYNPSEIVPKVENMLIECHAIPQTIGKISPATKLFDRVFAEERIVPGNPVLKWQIKNVVIRYDQDNNIKAEKNKSKDSIDGVYSGLNALELFRQVYEDQFYNYGDQKFIT